MNAEISSLLQALNLQPIAVQPMYRMITGSYSSAVILSQIMYWHSKMGRKFYKTDEDFAGELFMSQKEFRTGKSRLKRVPFLTIKAEGVPAKTFYDVSYDAYFTTMKSITPTLHEKGLTSLPQTVHSSLPQMVQTGIPQMVQTITETTTETTAETTNTLCASADGTTETWISKKGRKLTGDKLEQFKSLWMAFSYKKGRADAIDAFLSIKNFSSEEFVTMVSAATNEASKRTELIGRGKTPIMLQGWITGRRWEDDITAAPQEGNWRDEIRIITKADMVDEPTIGGAPSYE